MNKAFLLLSFIFPFSVFSQQILSPDLKVKVILTTQHTITADKKDGRQVSFQVFYKDGREYKQILSESPLGILRNDQQFVHNLEYLGEGPLIELKEDYTMVSGKRRLCRNRGNEKTFKYRNDNGRHINIVFRVYEDGIAFKYVFPDSTAAPVAITDEATAYKIPTGATCWMQPYSSAYEGFYPKSVSGPQAKSGEWGYPALFQIKESLVWALISEANITEQNCAARLSNKENTELYKVTYPTDKKAWYGGAVSNLPWQSQWHIIVVGTLAKVVESTLVTDVSRSSVTNNTEWIKPGAAAWIYWAYNHGSKDYSRVIEYIDLAFNMKWPYVLIDWEWDAMANGGSIEDALKYARAKGIKTILWYNSGTDWLDATPVDRLLTREKRLKEFTLLNKLGVSGIKVDFFAGDHQQMMKYYLEILQDALQFQLLVNFHGSTVPKGWNRTYPNLMTMEAVYGAEWYNNNAVLTDRAAEHNTVLPFTRNVIGSMDYTPVTFSNSQYEHKTTFGHELALSVVFESGIQHFADRPSAYNSLPQSPRDFLSNVPVAWDDTKLLDGYPGERIVIARRKGKTWYLAGLNGQNQEQTLWLNLEALKIHGKYTLELHTDNDKGKSFSSSNQVLNRRVRLPVKCVAGGGFAAVLRPY